MPPRTYLRIFLPHWLAWALFIACALQWLGEFGHEPDLMWLLLSFVALLVTVVTGDRAHRRVDDWQQLRQRKV